MRTIRFLVLLLASTALACVAPIGSNSDAGKTDHSAPADAGPAEPLDASFTVNPITKASYLCACPGQSAGELSSSGGTQTTWTASFPSTMLADNDQVSLDFDIAGSNEWQVGLVDATGNLAFPATGGHALSSGAWNCVHATYDIGQAQYNVWVDSVGSPPISAPLSTTVAGIQIKYTGTAASQAWFDSIEVTHTSMSGMTTLFSQSFDNPDTVQAGLSAGMGFVAMPPSADMPPVICPG